jgi:hypothetical protein
VLGNQRWPLSFDGVSVEATDQISLALKAVAQAEGFAFVAGDVTAGTALFSCDPPIDVATELLCGATHRDRLSGSSHSLARRLRSGLRGRPKPLQGWKKSPPAPASSSRR